MRAALLLAPSLLGCSTRLAPAERTVERARSDDELPIEVLFCPDDDTVSAELAEIERVAEARRADAATYPVTENPYRIRYAVYNLRNPVLVEALADARDDGVAVQILMDADQLDPARDWNWADDYLRDERGFSFAEDHRALSEAERATTELVGIDGAGLMHLKTRLFETPAERTLVTGSMNPGDDAVSNDETWHLIRDERIFDRYADLYDAVSYERPIVNEWVDGAGLNVLSNPESSGPDAGARLLGWLQEEDEQILIMAFSLRDLTAPGVSGSLVSILGEKVAAGVPVVVITDRNQSDGTYDGTEDKLRAVGVHVYEARNYATEFTAMHHKVAVLGRTDLRVITDAANWSKAGLGSATKPADNVESTLFVEPGYDGGKLGQRYLAQFVRVLGRYAEQSAAEGEPSFDELGPELMGLPGWPEHEVTFVAEEAYTSWGETVRVTGDLPELGAWGATGLGHPLWTEPSSYPTWSSPEPLRLPVGATFEYKLVAERDGVFRWEAGDNHVGFAQPPAFAEGLGSTQVNLWR